MHRLALALALLAAAVGSIPVEDPAHGDLVSLVELADVATGSPQQLDVGAGKEEGPGAAKRFTFAGTLQHVTNRFCTEREKKYGNGAIFCNELIGLQHKWVDATALGKMSAFTRLLGVMSGHFCPTKKATEDARCLVLSLLTKAVPAGLRWNADRKRYLQMTKDVGKHYCSKYGDSDLFCPLVRALKNHYFNAVMTQNDEKYVAYVHKLSDHYCVGPEIRHTADERCNIFPLLLKAVPAMDGKTIDGEVLEDRHTSTKVNGGDVPAVDERMQFRSDIIAATKEKKEDALKPVTAGYSADTFNPDEVENTVDQRVDDKPDQIQHQIGVN